MLACAQRALEMLTGKIELNPSNSNRGSHPVAKLELTGERLALLAQEAAVSETKQKQGAIKMVAGARLVLYSQRPPPVFVDLL